MASPRKDDAIDFEMSHDDVVRIMCEFCRLSGYRQACRTLQQESMVPSNVIESLLETEGGGSTEAHATEAPKAGEETSSLSVANASASVNEFKNAVLAGNWSDIVDGVDGLLISKGAQFALYETLVKELALLYRHAGAALQLLHHSPVFKVMKHDEPTRFARLVALVESSGSAAAAQGGTASAAAVDDREALWKMLEREITFRPKRTLQQHQQCTPTNPQLQSTQLVRAVGSVCGAALRGNRNASSMPSMGEPLAPSLKRSRGEVEAPSGFLPPAGTVGKVTLDRPMDGVQSCIFATSPTRHGGAEDDDAVTPGKNSKATSMPQLVVGTLAGDIRLFVQGTLLPPAPAMRQADSVLSMDVDSRGQEPDWLVAGYLDGAIRVFSLATMKLLRQLPEAHARGVTAVKFLNPENPRIPARNYLISSSFDCSVRVHSIRSARTGIVVLAEHTGYVHDVAFLSAVSTVASASHDGCVKFWELDSNALPSSQGGAVASRVTWTSPPTASGSICACIALAVVYSGRHTGRAEPTAEGPIVAIATQSKHIYLCTSLGVTLRTFELLRRSRSDTIPLYPISISIQLPSSLMGVSQAEERAIHVLASNGAVYSLAIESRAQVLRHSDSGGLTSNMEFISVDTEIQLPGGGSGPLVAGGVVCDRTQTTARVVVWSAAPGAPAFILDGGV